MNRLLEDIVADKKRDLGDILSQSVASPEAWRDLAFQDTLVNATAPVLICEIKKASPSQGVICEDFDPVRIATAYKDGGASALSVLTDERYFQGAPGNVARAKAASGLPILCKDFFIDPRQIKWARDLGADAVLLIMRILSDSQAAELYSASAEEGLDVLVETHNEADIERALVLGATMIGVNNRDLDTFEVSLETAGRLMRYIPEPVLAVAESGINTNADITLLQTAGFNTFLVGSSLMRADDTEQAVKDLRGAAF